ncbi:hypothetical protein TKK_0015223 [Trichogramma kaykai]|uniref:LITAF domain-containing protein n=1 Tax=Trichogramma kaykai TaxID=54128 RepID=A0ABD2WAV7_9HYME
MADSRSKPAAAVQEAEEFGEKPVSMKCPLCHENIVTQVDKVATCKYALLATLSCLLCVWVCCLQNLLLCRGMMVNEHTCPMCKEVIAVVPAEPVPMREVCDDVLVDCF